MKIVYVKSFYKKRGKDQTESSDMKIATEKYTQIIQNAFIKTISQGQPNKSLWEVYIALKKGEFANV